MEITIKHYSQLTVDEMYDILAIREDVFEIEQNCIYRDVDGLDKDAYQLVMRDNGRIVGTLRILRRGAAFEEASLGRIITLERGKGYGKVIVEEGLRFLREELHEDRARILAQLQAKGFYEKCGFKAATEPRMHEGLMHLEMVCDISEMKPRHLI